MISIDALLEGLKNGEDWAIAKGITVIERKLPEMDALLNFLRKQPKRAHRIGVTGQMGSGKSTLIAELAKVWLSPGKTVGVIAIDPSSRETGGAFLGDRLRMIEHCLEKRFYLRSMATRSDRRGLVRRIRNMLDMLDAAGKDIAVVETIGASQDAVDVRRYVQTLIWVLVPTGDTITYQKAGLSEVADIFVMNQCDSPGADRPFAALKDALGLQKKRVGWEAKVFKTIAIRGNGVAEVAEAIEQHRLFISALKTSQKKNKKGRAAE